MSKQRKLKFEYGPSGKDGLYYWRIKARNGEIIAQGEGYKRKRSARAIFRLLQDAFDHFLVVEREVDAKGKPVPEPKFVGTVVSS